MNIGAVLIVEKGGVLEFSTVRSLLRSRLPRVRRMRQRLMPTPFGCGGPLWVDDPRFDLDRHLRETTLPEAVGTTAGQEPVGDDRLLRVAADLACTRLPRNSALWTALWVTGLADERAALVLVMHHAMTEGVGGLTVLAALGDNSADCATDTFPDPWPSLHAIAIDAWRARAVAVIRAPDRLLVSLHRPRDLGLGLGLGRRAPTLATRTSLNRPTGSGRRLTTLEVPLAGLSHVAHTRGCTVNDILLTAVSGAMARVLNQRGERPTELVISVPVSMRRSTTADPLGNHTAVVPFRIPTLPNQLERLRRVAQMSHAYRAEARGTSAGPMGLVFRALGALGLFQVFIDHQRLVHTFVTNVRGPSGGIVFAGHHISAVIPVAVTPGNVGVCFDVLSCAGKVVVTVVADPEILPEQNQLTDVLADELTELIQLTKS